MGVNPNLSGSKRQKRASFEPARFQFNRTWSSPLESDSTLHNYESTTSCGGRNNTEISTVDAEVRSAWVLERRSIGSVLSGRADLCGDAFSDPYPLDQVDIDILRTGSAEKSIR